MNKIENIAGVHLGNNKRYETPNAVDPSLLVKIPRDLNREDKGIDASHFQGYDVWVAYEFSCLSRTGVPDNSVLKIVYPSDSEFIVESKSLKLYLNSWYMVRSERPNDFACIIAEHLSALLKTDVRVTPFIVQRDKSYVHLPMQNAMNLDNCFSRDDEVKEYSGSDPYFMLKGSKTTNYNKVSYYTHSLRSNCRVTNQPDTGTLYLDMEGIRHFDPVDFGKYIYSFRKVNHFHEEVCEVIFNDIDSLFSPERLVVACQFERRGGISINPFRAKGGYFEYLSYFR
jgi:7-cyano-7-deazaguanine reductase